jgi:hypothetical protein
VKSRMLASATVAAVVLLVATAMTALLQSGHPTQTVDSLMQIPQVALAVDDCGTVPAYCIQPPHDLTYRWSNATVFHVQHFNAINQKYIQPNTGESVRITVTWRTTAAGTICNCTDHIETTDINVNWNPATELWDCTNCGAPGAGSPDILDVKLCSPTNYSCLHSSGGTPPTYTRYAWVYGIKVKVNHTVPLDCDTDGIRAFYLHHVTYQAYAINSGWPITDCTLGSSANPTTSMFQATDNGAFDCTEQCDGIGAGNGAQLPIQY